MSIYRHKYIDIDSGILVFWYEPITKEPGAFHLLHNPNSMLCKFWFVRDVYLVLTNYLTIPHLTVPYLPNLTIKIVRT